jgi:divalent metal cation (Fe/Co/Zn/Cd) transporter
VDPLGTVFGTPENTLSRIRKVISANAEGAALEAHDLHAYHAGKMTFVDFHLVVPGDMAVSCVPIAVHVEPLRPSTQESSSSSLKSIGP